MTDTSVRDEDPISVDDQIRELFAIMLQMPAEEVDRETRPANVPRWDSMQHLILVSEFEQKFGIDVDPAEAVEMYEGYHAFKTLVIEKIQGRG
jgi:acyl carrier protein